MNKTEFRQAALGINGVDQDTISYRVSYVINSLANYLAWVDIGNKDEAEYQAEKCREACTWFWKHDIMVTFEGLVKSELNAG